MIQDHWIHDLVCPWSCGHGIVILSVLIAIFDYSVKYSRKIISMYRLYDEIRPIFLFEQMAG